MFSSVVYNETFPGSYMMQLECRSLPWLYCYIYVVDLALYCAITLYGHTPGTDLNGLGPTLDHIFHTKFISGLLVAVKIIMIYFSQKNNNIVNNCY